jgi:phosphoribosylformylglycinamidine synthase
MKDFNKAITPHLRAAGNKLFLLGDRKNELGASEFYHLLGHLGANVPKSDFEEARKEIYTVIDGIDEKLIESCHDISEGGMLACVAEMTMPHPRKGGGKLGVKLNLSECGNGLTTSQKAFSETGGFVVEVKEQNLELFKAVCAKNHLKNVIMVGVVIDTGNFEVDDQGVNHINIPLPTLQEAWLNSLAAYLK